MKRSSALAIAAPLAAAIVLSSSVASANDNDLFLSGLVLRCGSAFAMDSPPELPCYDPTDSVSPLSQDFVAKARYKLLGYQLGVALAPRPMAPAETLGYNGFQISIETSFTTIDRTGGTADNDASSFWMMGTERPLEGPGTFGGRGDAGILQVTTVMVRKGLPWSFEIAAGGSYLANSEIVTGNLQVKWSVFEGFHDIAGGVGQFLPDVAVRGEVSRAMGTGEIDLTVAGFDVSISKPFGIGGMWNLTPYLGWQYLIVSIRSEVVDFTPENPPGCVGSIMTDVCVKGMDDPFTLTPGEASRNDVYPDEDIIISGRFFAGFRIVYTHFSLVAELIYTPGFTETVAPSRLTVGGSEYTLKAKDQITFSFAAAADF